MIEERYHVTTQNRFYPDMSNVNKNITVEAKLISPPTYIQVHGRRETESRICVISGFRREVAEDCTLMGY